MEYSNIGKEIESENMETTSKNRRGNTQNMGATALTLFVSTTYLSFEIWLSERQFRRWALYIISARYQYACTLKENGIKNDNVYDRGNNGFL